MTQTLKVFPSSLSDGGTHEGAMYLCYINIKEDYFIFVHNTFQYIDLHKVREYFRTYMYYFYYY